MVVLFCLWAHDVLDLLHGTDRRPWWPLSERAVGVLWEQMDWGLNGELLLFGSGFALFLLVRGVSLRWRRPDGRARQAPQPASSRRLILLGHVMTTLILLCAAGTHYARGVRERQFDAAEALLARHDYPGALAALDEADRWPSTAKPGRTDYLRAEACLGLGDRARAEEHYIRSCRADPAYFWALADLTVFYATSDAPLDERRRRTAPYVKRLRRDFAGHEGLPGLLQRLERRLAAPVPRPVSTAGA
jgi:tetratricopeptide (TPR) repeat protein